MTVRTMHGLTSGASVALLVFVTGTVAACGGAGKSDAAPPSTSAGQSPDPGQPSGAQAPAGTAASTGASGTAAPSPPAGSAMPVPVETAKARHDSLPLRDSAFGPKFTMDSTGKIVPVKRP